VSGKGREQPGGKMGLEVVGGVVIGLALAVYLIMRFSKKNR
jgi:hypothetical protein